MIDTHIHVLPGIDDGPADLGEAVAMCRMAAADGVDTIIATPHQRHVLWPNRGTSALAERCAEVQRAVGDSVRILPGAEIRVDAELLEDVDRIPESGLTPLAGSHHLLIEFPTVGGPEPRHLVHELAVAGWRPILAHVERIPRWIERPEEVVDLVRLGARVQVTARSLFGHFGRRARACCTWLLDRGLAHLLGSDAHDTVERPPELGRGHEAITKGWGAAMADRMTILNPADVIADRPIPGPGE
jgi:protein-tyrosine phosphatase